MDFQFDPQKAARNRQKHGVSFADAEGVFYDDFAIHKQDQFISSEDRYIAIGLNTIGRVLVVVYTYRGTEIRLISARGATRNERRQYESRI